MLVASTEDWEIVDAVPPALAFDPELDRRRRLLMQADTARRQGIGAELVLAADQFIITPAGARRRRGPRPRRGRRNSHRHRRLLLVHRLGPRHDDQPRRPDALHRPPRRGRLHSAHFRQLRSRRPDPQLVSRRPQRRAVPHGRRHALVLSRHRPLRPLHRRPGHAAAISCRSCVEIIEHHLRGTRFGIGVDPDRRPAEAGEQGYQLTWMDAKVGDWVVTPRRGKAVEINALWYNALRLWRLARAKSGTMPAGPTNRPAVPPRPARRSMGGFGTPRELPLRRGRRRARRRPGLPAESILRHFARPSGARPQRAGKPVLDVVRERLLTPVGLRSLGPGRSRLQAALRRRPASARRGLSPGHRLGLADRPVHRRLAQGASGRPRTARRVPSRLRPHIGRSVRRLDQRSLRRRAALHAAGLHGAGLERGRSADPGSKRPNRTLQGATFQGVFAGGRICLGEPGTLLKRLTKPPRRRGQSPAVMSRFLNKKTHRGQREPATGHAYDETLLIEVSRRKFQN